INHFHSYLFTKNKTVIAKDLYFFYKAAFKFMHIVVVLQFSLEHLAQLIQLQPLQFLVQVHIHYFRSEERRVGRECTFLWVGGSQSKEQGERQGGYERCHLGNERDHK